MKVRGKGKLQKDFIERLYKKGIVENVPLWKSLAITLNKPNRRRPEVSLAKIEKIAGRERLW